MANTTYGVTWVFRTFYLEKHINSNFHLLSHIQAFQLGTKYIWRTELSLNRKPVFQLKTANESIQLPKRLKWLHIWLVN